MLMIHRRQVIRVTSFADASAKYCMKRNRAELQGRGGISTFPGAIIEDGNGNVIARVSYNGRVWPPTEWTPEQRPLFDPSDPANMVPYDRR